MDKARVRNCLVRLMDRCGFVEVRMVGVGEVRWATQCRQAEEGGAARAGPDLKARPVMAGKDSRKKVAPLRECWVTAQYTLATPGCTCTIRGSLLQSCAAALGCGRHASDCSSAAAWDDHQQHGSTEHCCKPHDGRLTIKLSDADSCLPVHQCVGVQP